MHNLENLLRGFKEANTHGLLAHAYLFAGAEGSGKRQAAREFSALALGVEEDRLMLHPDFMALERGGESGDKEIRIEEVRELKSRLALTSAYGGRRIAIIERVELLSGEAASALLKLLEDPPAHTTLLMTANRFSAVLPTIRSRAVRVAFPPPQKSTVDALSVETAKELRVFFSDVQVMPLGVRFRASERYAKDAKALKECIAYAAETVREHLLQSARNEKAAGRAIAAARSLLRTDALLAHTNTSPRLALDIFLMNL